MMVMIAPKRCFEYTGDAGWGIGLLLKILSEVISPFFDLHVGDLYRIGNSERVIIRSLSGGMMHKGPDFPHNEPLSEVASHLLEECRMVLPGIQALFGFQLMAAFNTKFWEIPSSSRLIHLLAISLVAMAVAFVMTPAAYHRLALKTAVSQSFIELSSKLLLCSMLPLLLGICLDFYLIAAMILPSQFWAIAISVSLAGIFASLWFCLPFILRASDEITKRQHDRPRHV